VVVANVVLVTSGASDDAGSGDTGMVTVAIPSADA
jgi:hypothetical protein